MKRLILFILLVTSTMGLQAQTYFTKPQRSQIQLFAASQTTRSIYGVKSGVNVGFSFNERWELSYFNHQSLVSEETSSHQYRGLNLAYIVNPRSRTQLGINSYMGFYNKAFFSMQFTLNMNYQIDENFFVAGEFGRSDGYPYFGIKAGVVLLSWKK